MNLELKLTLTLVNPSASPETYATKPDCHEDFRGENSPVLRSRKMDAAQVLHLCPDFPPSSLMSLITSYHHSHSNSLRVAHIQSTANSDAPETTISPIALIAKAIAPFFSHIHISCHSNFVLTQARANLSSYQKLHWHQARFTFSIADSSISHLSFAIGGVDLCVVLVLGSTSQAVTAAKDWIYGIQNMLTPNGVMAVISVGARPRVLMPGDCKDSGALERLQEAVDELYGQLCETKDQAPKTPSFTTLDWLDIDPEKFYENVTKRINIYVSDEEKKSIQTESLEFSPKIRGEERVYFYGEGEEEAAGWKINADKAWFDKYANLLLPNPLVNGQKSSALEIIEESLDQYWPDHKVTLTISCALALATRNMKN